MTFPLARTVRKLKAAISRRLPQRRDDSGLTTLEWLLIVAAVAGLAALAVVLVQNVVSETGEQIAGSSARLTAAKVAGTSVVDEAKNPTISQFLSPAVPTATAAEINQAWIDWDNYFTTRCNRIEITFSDADVSIDVGFARPLTAGTAFNAAILGVAAAAATGVVPQALCTIS